MDGLSVNLDVAIISVAGVVIAAIIKLVPKNNGGYVRKDVCNEVRKGIHDKLDVLGKKVDSILKEIRK